jgi:hypothetical protein
MIVPPIIRRSATAGADNVRKVFIGRDVALGACFCAHKLQKQMVKMSTREENDRIVSLVVIISYLQSAKTAVL